ncbi:MAG: response regulator [Jatrophihabitans sp.]|uniref:response regulator n=1 Tax=Jatrophihabitans sp. TaxID=1932789 RepID=UPI003F7F0D03
MVSSAPAVLASARDLDDPLRDVRVLVVDDTPEVRALWVLMLERYEQIQVVGQAGDGLAGIEAARRTQPDLVLLDVAMPVMTGLEALPRIRAEAPHCRVVMVSGLTVDRLGEQAHEAGAAAYIQKGTAPAQMMSVVGEVLGRPLVRRARRRTET